jgi:hypothetical protein
MEDAMREEGWNETRTRDVFGSPATHVEFPRSSSDNNGIMASLRYRINRGFSIGVILDNSNLGETIGRQEELSLLIMKYSATTVAAVVSAEASLFHLGIGPALYFPKAKERSEGDAAGETQKMGMILDLGLAFPQRSRFFGELLLQYRHVGKVQIGPITRTIGLTGPSGTFSAKVSYSHLFMGVGVGIRI